MENRALAESNQGTGLRARPEERFARAAEKVARGPFLWFLLVCLLLHAAALFVLLVEQWGRADFPTPEQEVAVEVVPESEVPKPAEQPPPPPPAQPQQAARPPEPFFERLQRTIHRHEEAAPSQQKLRLDEKIATDAPRAEKENPSERDAPDNETKSQRVEKQRQELVDTQPEPQQQQKAQQEQSPEASPEEQATAPKLEDKTDKRDAEVIERAAPKVGPHNDKTSIKPRVGAARGEQQKSIAAIVASLAPTPEFKAGGRSRGAPISGGNANPNYLSVVFGYIMRHYGHHNDHQATGGVISFYVDPSGNLIHQAVRQSSSSPGRDQEALSALRRAGPFPPTPTGTPVGIVWTY
ncbi:MAG TPA: TonB family protein [Methylocystis sp.]|nr:TonB family protein [Methylocystis sp.]